MITGSGQVDRDENHKRLRLNVFGELAGRLAGRGFDSLRYDKRGVGRSEGDFWTAGLYDNAAGVAAAVDYVRADAATRDDEVFLLGHSEGAFLATQVAAKTQGLAGVILLAGGARSGEDELRWQAEQVAKGLRGFQAFLIRLLRIDVFKAQAKQIAKIKRSTADFYRVQGLAKVNAKWMREFLDYNPAGDLVRITCPVLAITGSKDIQVSPDNLPVMKNLVKGPFESHAVPDVTHILRADPGLPTLSTYKEQVKKPVDPRVVDLILDWLESRTGLAST